MKKYIGCALAALIMTPAFTFAQNELDVLRYSELQSGATARSLGLGGTGGSYGADFSSLSINPAGIGVYRSSEIMITPTLKYHNLNTTYMGEGNNDDKSKLGINNFGIVFTHAAKGQEYSKSNWKAFSFGIGYNKLADYNANGMFGGINNLSSITDIFSADAIANGVGQNLVPPFGYLGYQSYLLDGSLSSIVRTNILNNGGSVDQSKTWSSKGNVGEYTLSFGGNYKEKLLMGLTMGLTSYSYENNSTFSEYDNTGNTDNDFQYLSYNDYLSTIGFGFNLKAGLIYVVNNQFRLGAAIHTPTWASMNDLSDYSIQTNTEYYKTDLNEPNTNPETYVQPDNAYEFTYSMTTPWRAVLSGTAFLGSNGFVTADYEYVDYASMRYSFSNALDKNYERQLNKSIKNTFVGGHNLRLGIEGRMDNFSGSVGFGYHSSPFENSKDFGGERYDISGGLGARFGSFFMDFAYMHITRKSSEFAYPAIVTGIPVGMADIKSGYNIFALTLGLKF